MAIALHQRHYRFGYDNATVVNDGGATHTWQANEDTAITMVVDTPFLLRLAVYEEGGTACNNVVNQFQCRKNGGSWQNITTSSTICKAVAVNAFTNGQDIPARRLTTRGTTDNTQAGCTEDGNSGGGANDIPANGGVECEAGLQLVSANLALNDTVEFRLVCTNPGALTLTLDVTPSLTVSLTPESEAPDVRAMALSGVQPTAVRAVPDPVIRVMWLSFETPDANVTQYSRPYDDSVDGNWLNELASNVDLHESLDETTPSDTTYIQSGATPVEDAVKMKLSPILRPKSGTVTLKFRGKLV